MSWTRSADLKAQVLKAWERGVWLASAVPMPTSNTALFPCRLRLAVPSSAELADRFEAVRHWADELRQGCPPCRVQERDLRHRVVGNHRLPEAVWVDSLADAAAFIGKTRDLRRFLMLLTATQHQQPLLLPWLKQRPMLALAHADAWPRLLAVVAWLQAHPRPDVYLRQVDIAGVDSKFIETHRAVLAELLDVALPLAAINASATGYSQFGRRYGFKDKPLRVRFRLLGESDGGGVGTDLTVTQQAFERLALPIRRVFITENETNFLAFPPVPHSLVVFGAGYGFDALASADWLNRCDLHYWGDIDTHGLAILDQLRVHFPHVQSLLMDPATWLAHQAHWGHEPQPVLRYLSRLTAEEAALLRALSEHTPGQHLRLEQERIGFGWVQRALERLGAVDAPGAEVEADVTQAGLRRKGSHEGATA